MFVTVGGKKIPIEEFEGGSTRAEEIAARKRQWTLGKLQASRNSKGSMQSSVQTCGGDPKTFRKNFRFVM